MKLYNYSRSSASFRVRIAANLKGLSYEYVSINLTKGESRTPAYETINPLGKVPTLEDNRVVLTQSLAICEYLEEKHPYPPLLPRDPAGRARVRSIALTVACEIHPVGGGRAQSYLGKVLEANEEQRAEWSRHWMVEGFQAIERMIAQAPETGRFCHGDAPTPADAFLVPQVYNALLARVEMTPFPTIRRIYDTCLNVDAIDRARPERQPNAPLSAAASNLKMGSKIDRKAITREYKARQSPRGIFAVRCTASAEVWVGSSRNLDGARNRIWFSLRTGLDKNAALQASWTAHGEPAFEYEILEKLADEVSELRTRDVLKERESYWLAQLGARPLSYG